MAKSLRSKVKRKARIIKRTDSHYAVADAERVQRLHERLTGKGQQEEGEEEIKDVQEGEDDGGFQTFFCVVETKKLIDFFCIASLRRSCRHSLHASRRERSS
jgi:hypothetical protein